MISREDEFRLLFLTDVNSEIYGNPPLSPYPPFGSVNLESTSLEVRLHFACGHKLVYQSWDWRCQPEAISDFGMSWGSDPEKLKSKANSLQLIWIVAAVACARLYKPSLGIRTWLRKVSSRISCRARNMTLDWTSLLCSITIFFSQAAWQLLAYFEADLGHTTSSCLG